MAYDDDDQPTDTSKFGAAQPLVDPIAKAYDKVRGMFKNVPGKDAPPQTVDHKDSGADPGMVDEANESFRKAAAKPEIKPTTPTTRKMIKKAPTKR